MDDEHLLAKMDVAEQRIQGAEDYLWPAHSAIRQYEEAILSYNQDNPGNAESLDPVYQIDISEAQTKLLDAKAAVSDLPQPHSSDGTDSDALVNRYDIDNKDAGEWYSEWYHRTQERVNELGRMWADVLRCRDDSSQQPMSGSA